MIAPLPQTIIRVPMPKGYSAVSSIQAKITQLDGSPFPLVLTKAKVSINWENGDPVTVDLTAIGGFALEASAGVQNIEINGKTYRLVEVEEG